MREEDVATGCCVISVSYFIAGRAEGSNSDNFAVTSFIGFIIFVIGFRPVLGPDMFFRAIPARNKLIGC